MNVFPEKAQTFLKAIHLTDQHVTVITILGSNIISDAKPWKFNKFVTILLPDPRVTCSNALKRKE
jgi:hypothetical protein